MEIQEKSGEENNSSPGDQFKNCRHSTGRVLVEEVRSKTDQRLTLPKVNTIADYPRPSILRVILIFKCLIYLSSSTGAIISAAP